MSEELLAAVRKIDDLQAQLAQAIAAKQSAVTMSEERLARALRAEDLLQLRAGMADDGALQAATVRAEKAETRVKDLEAVQSTMEAYRDERREALRVLNADFYSIGDLRGDPSWLTPAAALKLRKMLNGASGDIDRALNEGALTVVKGLWPVLTEQQRQELVSP